MHPRPSSRSGYAGRVRLERTAGTLRASYGSLVEVIEFSGHITETCVQKPVFYPTRAFRLTYSSRSYRRSSAYSRYARMNPVRDTRPQARTSKLALRAAYRSQCQDGLTGRFDRLRQTMAPGYVNIDVAGNRATAERTVRDSEASFKQYKIESCATRILTSEQRGNKIVTTIIEQTRGKVPAGHTLAPLDISQKMNDAWIRQADGSLKIASSSTIELTVRVNGKVVQHAMAAAKPRI